MTPGRPKTILLTGVDASGKTTQAHLLIDELRGRGIRCQYVWLRFPQLFSLPVLALMRVVGVTHYETTNGQRRGTWRLRRLRWLASLLLWCQAIDAAVIRLIRIELPRYRGHTVVVDRFVYDIVVDVSVAARDASLLWSLPARLLRRLAPKGPRILLDCPASVVRTRRYGPPADALDLRIALYRAVARADRLWSVDASQTADSIHRRILAHVAPSLDL